MTSWSSLGAGNSLVLQTLSRDALGSFERKLRHTTSFDEISIWRDWWDLFYLSESEIQIESEHAEEKRLCKAIPKAHKQKRLFSTQPGPTSWLAAAELRLRAMNS